MRRISSLVLLLLAAHPPSLVRAQASTPTSSVRRLDSLPASAVAPLTAPPHSGVPVCMDCGGWPSWGPGAGPGYVIRDSGNHVLLKVARGDSTQRVGDTLEPRDIASIDVAKGQAAVAVLGPGSENGVVIITLTPEGVKNWRRRQKASHPH